MSKYELAWVLLLTESTSSDPHHEIALWSNISFRIIGKLPPAFTDSKQVRELGLENTADNLIWKYAKDNNYTLVTFDSDFIDIAILKGFPPKIVWLKTGNSSTENIAGKILIESENLLEFLNDDNAFFEIN